MRVITHIGVITRIGVIAQGRVKKTRPNMVKKTIAPLRYNWHPCVIEIGATTTPIVAGEGGIDSKG